MLHVVVIHVVVTIQIVVLMRVETIGVHGGVRVRVAVSFSTPPRPIYHIEINLIGRVVVSLVN